MTTIENRFHASVPPTHTHTQWTLRLDPNDRPSCSQLLRHELFTKGTWSERFTTELRSKVEKELEDNPLLKNLGITIHGSLHDSKQRSSSDKLSTEPQPVPKKVWSQHLHSARIHPSTHFTMMHDEALCVCIASTFVPGL